MARKNRLFAKLASDIDDTGNITTAGLATSVTASIEDGGTSVYDSASQLPISGNSAGDTAFVKSTSRLYINSGVGWYNVAVINNTPTVQSILDSDGGTTPFALATDGTPTTITITAQDSDGEPLTYNYSADSDFGGLATLSQDANVFTITPFSEDSATTTSGTITFSVTDGINTATPGAQTFSLEFTSQWEIASTGSFSEDNTLYVNTYETYPRVIGIDPTLTYLTMGGNGYKLHSYTLGTAGDVSTGVYQSSFPSSGTVRYSGMDWNTDGSEFYVVNYTSNVIQQYSVTTNYVVGTSPTLVGSYTSPGTVMMGLHVSPDGTKVWSIAYSGSTVYEFNLSTAWDITSVSSYNTFTSSSSGSPTDIRWNAIGTQMILLNQNTGDFLVYEPTTAFTFNGLSSTASHTVSATGALGYGFDISDDGTVWFIGSNNAGGNVRKYTVTLS